MEPGQPEKSRKKTGEKLVAEYLQEMGILPEVAEKYAHEVLKKSPKEKPMVLVRKALALYEADETQRGNAASTPEKKKRRGRPPKAEKSKADDPEDLRNAKSYEEMKEKDGGNA